MASQQFDIPAPVDRIMNVVGRGYMLGFPFLPGMSSDSSTGVPTNGIVGFAPGALFINLKAAGGVAIYTNIGTAASATWSLLSAAGGSQNSTFANGIAVTGGNAVLTGGVNVQQSAANGTGTKFGTSPFHNMAFFNATPINQPSGANQGLANSPPNAATNFTISNATATNTTDASSIINNNINALQQEIQALRNALINLGLYKGAA